MPFLSLSLSLVFSAFCLSHFISLHVPIKLCTQRAFEAVYSPKSCKHTTADSLNSSTRFDLCLICRTAAAPTGALLSPLVHILAPHIPDTTLLENKLISFSRWCRLDGTLILRYATQYHHYSALKLVLLSLPPAAAPVVRCALTARSFLTFHHDLMLLYF